MNPDKSSPKLLILLAIAGLTMTVGGLAGIVTEEEDREPLPADYTVVIHEDDYGYHG